MYIIELIIKKLTGKKEEPSYNPLYESGDKDFENCEHIFMPVDSTNETLSCTKCGIIVKVKGEKKLNS